MLTLRHHDHRGHFDHGWLDTRHSFSFADYYDPEHMGVSHLRVINDDVIAPGGGFPTHPHRDMEILTYVMEGALAHRDSMGNGTSIQAGEVQRMSAGRGITHSEFNASRDEPVHLLQIWLLPRARGLPSGYEQRCIPDDEKRGVFRLIATPDGRDNSLTIQQDVSLQATILESGERLEYRASPGRILYLHLARGRMTVNGERLTGGDAVTVQAEPLRLLGDHGGEALLFDLPDLEGGA